MLPNSRTLRIILYVVVGLLFVGAIIWDAARRFGVNPFENNAILYWGLVVLVGVYVTARIAMIIERHRKRRVQDEEIPKRGSFVSMFTGSNSRDLNRRMQARRERVHRAKLKTINEDKAENE